MVHVCIFVLGVYYCVTVCVCVCVCDDLQRLVEKLWYAVLETFILLAGFHQDLQLGFVGTIALLFIIKAFHWLIEERIDYVSAQ